MAYLMVVLSKQTFLGSSASVWLWWQVVNTEVVTIKNLALPFQIDLQIAGPPFQNKPGKTNDVPGQLPATLYCLKNQPYTIETHTCPSDMMWNYWLWAPSRGTSTTNCVSSWVSHDPRQPLQSRSASRDNEGLEVIMWIKHNVSGNTPPPIH